MSTTITKEAPLGNEWVFSKANYKSQFRPGKGVKEITNPTGIHLAVVNHIRNRFIQPEWSFAALIKNLPGVQGDNSHHLITVFTHPTRTDLPHTWPHNVGDFLQLDFASASDPYWYDRPIKEDDPLNQILNEANFVVDVMWGGHHGVKVGNEELWQTGVGYFDISLYTYKQLISHADAQLEDLRKQTVPLQERKEALVALQRPSPVPLF